MPSMKRKHHQLQCWECIIISGRALGSISGLYAVRFMHLLARGHIECGASGLLRRHPFAPSRRVSQDCQRLKF